MLSAATKGGTCTIQLIYHTEVQVVRLLSLHVADAVATLKSLKLLSVDFIALSKAGTVRPENDNVTENSVRTKRRGGTAG